MQLEHDPQKAAVQRRRAQVVARARIHHDKAEVIRGRGRGGHRHAPEIVTVFFGRGVLRHAIGVNALRHGHGFVQGDGARGHAGGQRRRLHFSAEPVPQLVVKDERQPRQAQQQHEDGANEAAPFVQPEPDAGGLWRHEMKRLKRQKVRGRQAA